MLVVDLQCELAHQFEGWFASSDELNAQRALGLLACPVCGSHEVARLPSAPHLKGLGSKAVEDAREAEACTVAPTPASPAVASPRSSLSDDDAESLKAFQALYLSAVRHVVEHTEDVGERFADEVRSMHHGDAPERAIRGQTSPEDKQALREEGIEVLSLPLPEGLKGIKGPLH